MAVRGTEARAYYKEHAMPHEFDIVESYVAVWNEADPEVRRRRIRAVWAPTGSTCYRLLDAHGHTAIEERVRGSWDKWLRDGKYVFRAKRVAAHHDAVKLDFVGVTVPDGKVEANGLSLLLLNRDGLIERDYQFNPSAHEPNDTVDRYLAVLNEADPMVRRRQIAELWAPDGTLFTEAAVKSGIGALQAEMADLYNAQAALGQVLASANRTQAHHNLVKFKWHAADPSGGAPSAAGTDFLILDDDGRIEVDYRFDDRRECVPFPASL
jgi:hypothetical protein